MSVASSQGVWCEFLSDNLWSWRPSGVSSTGGLPAAVRKFTRGSSPTHPPSPTRGKKKDRVNTLLSLLPWCLPQVATCVRTTATGNAPCTGPCTRCAGLWAPAAQRPLHPHRSCLSGCGTCPGRCACAPALCPAWRMASVLRRGSSRAPGLDPSRACSCPRRKCRPAP